MKPNQNWDGLLSACLVFLFALWGLGSMYLGRAMGTLWGTDAFADLIMVYIFFYLVLSGHGAQHPGGRDGGRHEALQDLCPGIGGSGHRAGRCADFCICSVMFCSTWNNDEKSRRGSPRRLFGWVQDCRMAMACSKRACTSGWPGQGSPQVHPKPPEQSQPQNKNQQAGPEGPAQAGRRSGWFLHGGASFRGENVFLYCRRWPGLLSMKKAAAEARSGLEV